MEEFDELWNNLEREGGIDDPPSEELNQQTPEYQLRDGTAKYKLLANMLGLYFHAKYGEPIDDIFKESQNNKINFHL